jgi:hypothetical protein
MKRVLSVLFLTLAVALPASAGMIATDAQDDRARVTALLERPEVQAEMQKMGIAPHEAAARVGAMSDGEVRQLAGRLDAAIAGGQLSNQNLLLLIILILLIVILV